MAGGTLGPLNNQSSIDCLGELPEIKRDGGGGWSARTHTHTHGQGRQDPNGIERKAGCSGKQLTCKTIAFPRSPPSPAHARVVFKKIYCP